MLQQHAVSHKSVNLSYTCRHC